MKEVKQYIKSITGFDVVEIDKPSRAESKLPLFIKKGYSFNHAKFRDQEVVFVEPNGEKVPTPNQLQKHIPKIESAFGCSAILLFENMSYYLRKQLTHNRIAFIVPEEQMFIPFMFMSLHEQQRVKRTKTEKYSPSTQCMLIYHLWKSPIDELNFQEIADLFFYTPRTIGRSARELEDSGVCKIVGSKSKNLQFKSDKKKIWDTAKKYMRSPEKRSVWFDFKKPDEAKISGINALSAYSNISGEYKQTYALDRSAYKQMKQGQEVEEENILHESDIKFELWDYDPAFLAKDEFVDPFSLYLTLQDNPNERIQMNLKKMIEGIF